MWNDFQKNYRHTPLSLTTHSQNQVKWTWNSYRCPKISRICLLQFSGSDRAGRHQLCAMLSTNMYKHCTFYMYSTWCTSAVELNWKEKGDGNCAMVTAVLGSVKMFLKRLYKENAWWRKAMQRKYKWRKAVQRKCSEEEQYKDDKSGEKLCKCNQCGGKGAMVTVVLGSVKMFLKSKAKKRKAKQRK